MSGVRVNQVQLHTRPNRIKKIQAKPRKAHVLKITETEQRNAFQKKAHTLKQTETDNRCCFYRNQQKKKKIKKPRTKTTTSG